MNQTAWNLFLNTLPEDHRDLAIKIMERVQAVINGDRSHLLNELQRGYRRSDGNAARINELALRLDHYEQQRADDVKNELERYARDQLPPDERDQLIAVLYNLVARVEQLEDSDRQSSEP
jgi:hypothetical protein